MEEFTIKLNAQHLQVIRAGLGKVPYDLAEPLIRHIRPHHSWGFNCDAENNF